MNKRTPNITGIFYALLAYFLFVLGDSFYKYLGQSYSIIQIAFYVKLSGTVVLILYMLLKKQAFKTYFPKYQFYRSAALTFTTFSVIYAYKSLSLTEVTLLFYTMPFLISFLTKFYLKEYVGIHRMTGIIIGFIGMLIIIRPGSVDFNLAHFVLLAGIGSMSYANTLTRKMGKSEPSINFTLLPTAMVMLCALPFIIVQPLMPVPVDIPLFVIAGILSALGFLLIAIAYVRTHASTISMLCYTEIIWALLLDYIIFNEVTNDPYTILGGIIIILSGLYVIYRENRARKVSQ